MTDLTPPQNSKPIWQAEQEHPDLCSELRTGLGEVVDPELGLSVIQLGLIRDVKIEPDQAIIRMILTTPFCPYGPTMLENVRQKAEEIVKRPTSMDFGLDPWDFSMMEEGSEPHWGMFI